jgi:hypothetical protein
MFNNIVGTGAVGAGAASRYGSGSDQKMRLLVAPAPAPQHCYKVYDEELIWTYQKSWQKYKEKSAVEPRSRIKCNTCMNFSPLIPITHIFYRSTAKEQLKY